VVLCCNGLFQRHLIRRAAEEFNLVGAVIQHSPPGSGSRWSRLKRYRNPRTLRRHLEARLFLPRYEHRGEDLRRALFWSDDAPAAIPADLPVLETTAINGPVTVAFLRRHAPDLVLVNGTQLLRQTVLALIPANFETVIIRSFHVGVELLLQAAHQLVEGRAQRVPQCERGKPFLRRTCYDYEPWQRLAANRLCDKGLIRDYLAHRLARDGAIRLVGDPS
jgi:hypothetical protein